MKIGTKTILYGTHQFLVHPLFVFFAWLIIYRKIPNFVQICAIITHDLGYWGQPNIDGDGGERHPAIAAAWWNRRFDEFGGEVASEILGHSRFYAKHYCFGKLSDLFYADKLAVSLYPTWLYFLLGGLTGEIKEYMALAKYGKYNHFNGKGKLEWWLNTRSKMCLMGLGEYGNQSDEIQERVKAQ